MLNQDLNFQSRGLSITLPNFIKDIASYPVFIMCLSTHLGVTKHPSSS